jgi:energy-coupling factor transporter transmembrane protein EcfT
MQWRNSFAKLPVRIEAGLQGVSRVMAIIAAIILAIMMLLTVADVIGRYFFSSPIKGTWEVVGLLLVFAGTYPGHGAHAAVVPEGSGNYPQCSLSCWICWILFAILASVCDGKEILLTPEGQRYRYSGYSLCSFYVRSVDWCRDNGINACHRPSSFSR